MQEAIRKLDISVISDVNLATMASKAKPWFKYLKSILPKTLVLNGYIIDSWRFSRNYFPKSHLKVIRLTKSDLRICSHNLSTKT